MAYSFYNISINKISQLEELIKARRNTHLTFISQQLSKIVSIYILYENNQYYTSVNDPELQHRAIQKPAKTKRKLVESIATYIKKDHNGIKPTPNEIKKLGEVLSFWKDWTFLTGDSKFVESLSEREKLVLKYLTTEYINSSENKKNLEIAEELIKIFKTKKPGKYRAYYNPEYVSLLTKYKKIYS